MAQFITSSYVVDLLTAAGITGVTTSNVPDDLIRAASQELINRCNAEVVQYSDYTVKLDGNDQTWIYVPYIPIVKIDEIKIYNSDRSEYEDITVDDISTYFIIDYDSGKIKTIESSAWTIAAATFISGHQNIEITGDFGIDGALEEDVKYITFLIVLRNLQLLNPNKFRFDIVREKLGKYEYALSTSGVAKDNEKLSLDGLIGLLIKALDDRDSIYIGDV